MPSTNIQVKDILIQGNKGQKISNTYPPSVFTLKKLTALPTREQYTELTSSGYIFVKSADSKGFFYFNKTQNTLQKIELNNHDTNNIEQYIGQHPDKLKTRLSNETLEDIQSLTNHSAILAETEAAIDSDPLNQSAEQIRANFGSGYSLVEYAGANYLVNPAENPPAILQSASNLAADKVNKIMDLIVAIKNHTLAGQENPEDITRSITDEFTFFPDDRPLTIAEYKQIISEVSKISSDLPPNIHLVLATFPVIWPNGKLRNCGLYVASPLNYGEKPIIHHFNKLDPSAVDPTYKRSDGTLYEYNSGADNANPELFANKVLEDTEVLTADINQYNSAFKIPSASGQDILVSVGICLDHSTGMERRDIHKLTEKLQANGQEIPLHCSHVITSYTIEKHTKHVVSTVSHADPKAKNRRPYVGEVPGRSGFAETSLESSFTGRLTCEHYPAKSVGIVHSDMFQHIIANKSATAVAEFINQTDNNGNTLLHDVFLESPYDGELIAKRLYFLILNGGDPHLENSAGKSVIDLAKDLSTVSSRIVTRAINSAIQWQQVCIKKNAINDIDGHTPLTRAAANININDFNELILSGANPYKKNSHGKSAMDYINEYGDEEIKNEALNSITKALAEVQNGYQRSGINYLSGEDKEFPTYIPDDFRLINMPNIEEILDVYVGILKMPTSEINPQQIKDIQSKLFNISSYIDNSTAYSAKIAYDAISHQLSNVGIILPAAENEADYFVLINNLKSCMLTNLVATHKNIYPEIISKPDDMLIFGDLAPNTRNALFSSVKPNLDNLLQKHTNLHFIQYLKTDDQEYVYDLIKTRFSDFIDIESKMSFIEYLPETGKLHAFALIKDKIATQPINLFNLDYIQYFTPQQQNEIVNLLINKTAETPLTPDDYSINFIKYLEPNAAERFLNSIPNDAWATTSEDLGLGNILSITQDNSKLFTIIFSHVYEEVLDSLHTSNPTKQKKVLAQLSQKPDHYLQDIQDNIAQIIQCSKLSTLKACNAEIKEIIEKTYAPNNYQGLLNLVNKLDEMHKQTFMKAIAGDIDSLFPNRAHVTEENFTQIKGALQKYLDEENPNSSHDNTKKQTL